MDKGQEIYIFIVAAVVELGVVFVFKNSRSESDHNLFIVISASLSILPLLYVVFKQCR